MTHHHSFAYLAALTALAGLLVTGALAIEIQEPQMGKPVDDQEQAILVLKGKRLAQQHCSGCHAIGKTGLSPRKECPPFRDLHKKWPVETLEESLAEGIVTGHNNMPEIKMSAKEIAAFIAFLKSLEK